MSSLERAALALRSGAPVVLQRVGRSVSPSDAVIELGRSGLIAEVVIGLLPEGAATGSPGAVRVVEGRGLPVDAWIDADPGRGAFQDAASRTLVLLDAASGVRALQNAPHLCSWAGGVALPVEPLVRPTRGEEEEQAGERLFQRIRAEHELDLHHTLGRDVGVDLLTGRLFLPRADRSALQAAREALDEGILYLTRVTG